MMLTPRDRHGQAFEIFVQAAEGVRLPGFAVGAGRWSRAPSAFRLRRLKRRGEAPSPERVVRVFVRPEPRQRSRIFEQDAFTGQQADLLAPAAGVPAMAGGEPRLGAGAIPLPAAGVTPV